MIKFIFAAARNPAMSQQEYRRYVSEVHGPLVISTPEVVAPMKRYVQHFALPGETDTASGIPVDKQRHCVVVMMMKSFEAMMASLHSPQYLEIIRPDEKRFEDPNTPVLPYIVDELTIHSKRGCGVKLFHFLKRRTDLSREEFQMRWCERQEERMRDVLPDSCGYVQNRVMSAGSLPFGVADDGMDLIEEYSFTDLRAMALFGKQAIARTFDTNLIDSARSFAVVAEPVTMLDRVPEI